MRYLASTEFIDKIKGLSKDAAANAAISRIFSDLEATTKEELLKGGTPYTLSALPNGIYLLRSVDTRVFFTFGTDKDGEYLLLLDIAQQKKIPFNPPFRVPKDPRTNTTLNPLFNTTLNPNFNTTLNPNFNTTLNPNFNTTLNPNFNTALNPNFNTTLNPNFNTTLNPNFNTLLNPHFNTTLNPRFNSMFDGPYVYDLKINRESFLVRANDNVQLMFGMNDLRFSGIAVKTSANGFLLFDTGNKWIGYLVPDAKGGYLRFNTKNEWTGFVV